MFVDFHRIPFRCWTKHLVQTLPVIFLATFASVATAQDQLVYYSIEKEGHFFVLYSRAAGNATGAALGGLIGAGIQAGVESGKDQKRERQAIERLSRTDCAPLLIESFRETLKATPGYSVTTENPNDEEHLRVEITIDRCGFKLVNSERMFVASFAEARFKIYQSDQDKPKKAKRLLLIGKERSTWNDLLLDNTNISRRFESSLQRSGKRLANKVIYHK